MFGDRWVVSGSFVESNFANFAVVGGEFIQVHSEMVKPSEEAGGVDWAAHEVEVRKISEDVSGERSLLLIYGLLAR